MLLVQLELEELVEQVVVYLLEFLVLMVNLVVHIDIMQVVPVVVEILVVLED
jgi:hypothetical protein